MKSLSCVQLFATPWTVAYQASPSMGFSWQGYWIGLLFPSPGDLPDPGIEPEFPALQADTLPSEPPCKPQCRHKHMDTDIHSSFICNSQKLNNAKSNKPDQKRNTYCSISFIYKY